MKRSIIITLTALLLTSSLFAQKTQTKMIISTKFGDIKIALYDETPLHRDNFIKLVKEGFYDSTLFHRVINRFMIQGGDPDSKNTLPGKPLGMGDVGYTVPAEFVAEKVHKKGALCAARQADQVNPKKASSGCQFYIVQGEIYNDAQLDALERQTGVKMTEAQRKAYTTVGGTPFLDREYTVFGEVVEGLDIIDTIASQQTGRSDRPLEDIRMTIKLSK